MVGEWFVEFYPADADRPDQPIYFDGFSATLSHIQSFRARILMGQLRVQVPAKTMDGERRQIREAGAIPN